MKDYVKIFCSFKKFILSFFLTGFQGFKKMYSEYKFFVYLLFNNMFHDDFTARCLGLAFTVLFLKVNNMMNA